MEIRKLIKEVFDQETLDKSIQNLENNLKDQYGALNVIKSQNNDLKRERFQLEKEKKQLELEKKRQAINNAKAMIDKNGVGTRRNVVKTGISSTV